MSETWAFCRHKLKSGGTIADGPKGKRPKVTAEIVPARKSNHGNPHMSHPRVAGRRGALEAKGSLGRPRHQFTTASDRFVKFKLNIRLYELGLPDPAEESFSSTQEDR